MYVYLFGDDTDLETDEEGYGERMFIVEYDYTSDLGGAVSDVKRAKFRIVANPYFGTPLEVSAADVIFIGDVYSGS